MLSLKTVRTVLSPLMEVDVVHSIYVIVDGYSIHVFTVLDDFSRDARFRVYDTEEMILDLCGFISFHFVTLIKDGFVSPEDAELIYERDSSVAV